MMDASQMAAVGVGLIGLSFLFFGIGGLIEESSRHSRDAWTTQKPVVSGWFWIRNTNLSARIVKIIFDLSRGVVIHDYLHSYRSLHGKDETFEYAGPIEPPTKP